MIIPLLFFFLDYVMWAICAQWIVYSVLAYFVVSNGTRVHAALTVKDFYFPLFLLIMQDSIRYNRCGLGFIYLVPIVAVMLVLRKVMLELGVFMPFVCITGALFLEEILVKKLVFGMDIDFFATLLKIFVTLGVGYLVLLGMRGNRSLFIFLNKGRKVWTPNRKDAS